MVFATLSHQEDFIIFSGKKLFIPEHLIFQALYHYSVVTDPDHMQLVVLARNVTGFTEYYNKPFVTYQGSVSKYIFVNSDNV